MEGRVVWKGEGWVSSGEDFGMVLWSVVRRILRWRGMVSVSGGSGVWGDSRSRQDGGGVEVDAGCLGVDWGGRCRSLEVEMGLMLGEGRLGFFQSKEEKNSSSHPLSLILSIGKKVKEEWTRVGLSGG